MDSAGLRDVLKKLSQLYQTELSFDELVLGGHLLLLYFMFFSGGN